VDGKQLLTSATMTVQALRDMSPVTFHLCGGRTSVPLGAGTHRVVVTGTSEWRAGGILLRDPAAAAPDAAGAAPIEVRHWDRTSRSVQLGARSAESLLVVHENVNAGWRAKLNGITLRKVTVDGWQQGYVVPAGAPGVLTLDFVPDHAYRAALLVGLAAVLVLALLAAVPAGRRRRSPPGAGSIARGTVVIPVLGLGFAIALAGLVAGSLAVAGTYLLAAGLTGSLGASAWNQRARAIIAAGLVLAAGINLAVHPWPQSDYAGDARVAQVLCLCAILLMTVPRRLPLVRRSGAEPSPEPGAAAASPAAPPSGRPVPTRESSGPSWS
jgi:arabinofuranan 3-O-arabinosyltransferase